MFSIGVFVGIAPLVILGGCIWAYNRHLDKVEKEKMIEKTMRDISRRRENVYRNSRSTPYSISPTSASNSCPDNSYCDIGNYPSHNSCDSSSSSSDSSSSSSCGD